MALPAADNIFTYKPLVEKDAIRLIRIEPSSEFETPVQCSIEHSTLSRLEDELVIHYTALSYVWGSVAESCTIYVDGLPFQIRPNLDSALRNLRETEPGRVLRLWADAICINQKDEMERNTQVQQMGRIYAAAHHTILYLGESTEMTNWTFNKLQLLSRCHSSSHWDNSHWESYDHPTSRAAQAKKLWNILETDVLAREWFSRVWIFQEFMLSKDPWVQCGSQRVRWDKFCKICSTLRQQSIPRVLEHTLIDEAEPKVLELLHNMQNRRHKLHYPGESHSEGRGSENTLLDLLSLRRGLHASDPRDRIFAHLGLASDHGDDPGNQIMVNYALTCEQVFSQAASYLILKGQFHWVLQEVLDCEFSERLLDLPSWVPDWRLNNFWTRDTYDKVVTSGYSSRKGDWRGCSPPSILSQDRIPFRLICKGWRFGTVSGLSDKLSYLSQSQDQVREAWEDLVNSYKNRVSIVSYAKHSTDSERMISAVSALLYNKFLGNLRAKIQHYMIRSDSYNHIGLYYWRQALSFETDRELILNSNSSELLYESLLLHPMALMCCLYFGESIWSRKNARGSSWEKKQKEMIKGSLFLECRRLGRMNLIRYLRYRLSKDSNATLPINRIVYGMSDGGGNPNIGLFSHTVEDGDLICMLDGSTTLVVCRSLPGDGGDSRDSGDNENVQHVKIVGECYPDTDLMRYFEHKTHREIWGGTPDPVPVTKFVIH